jgi:hypothetical protein
MQSACAILSSVACPDLQHFSKLSHNVEAVVTLETERITGSNPWCLWRWWWWWWSHKQHDYRESLMNIKYVFWFFLQHLSEIFLGAFARLRKVKISFVMSVRLSVFPHGKTRLPQDGFSWKLIFENFSKICAEDLSSIWAILCYVLEIQLFFQLPCDEKILSQLQKCKWLTPCGGLQTLLRLSLFS